MLTVTNKAIITSTISLPVDFLRLSQSYFKYIYDNIYIQIYFPFRFDMETADVPNSLRIYSVGAHLCHEMDRRSLRRFPPGLSKAARPATALLLPTARRPV